MNNILKKSFLFKFFLNIIIYRIHSINIIEPKSKEIKLAKA